MRTTNVSEINYFAEPHFIDDSYDVPFETDVDVTDDPAEDQIKEEESFAGVVFSKPAKRYDKSVSSKR